MPSYDWKPVERWYQLPPGQTYVRECSWMVSVGHIRHVMYFIHWFIHFTLSSYLLGIFLVATLDSVTHDILPIQWGLEISMDLSGEAKKAKIPEPWKWQVEIIGEAGTGRRTKIWTSRHWLQWSQKQLTDTRFSLWWWQNCRLWKDLLEVHTQYHQWHPIPSLVGRVFNLLL